MLKFSNLKVGTRLACLSVVAVVGVGALLGVSLSALERLKVGGPLYQTVSSTKDLLADILPPPAYIIESYLNCHELADAEDTKVIDELVASAKRLSREYDTSLSRWTSQLPQGELRTLIVTEAGASAREIYRLRDQELIPLVLTGKLEKARELVADKIEPLFREHDGAIRKGAELAAVTSKEHERAAAAEVSSVRLVVLASAAGLAASVVAASWLIARSVTRPLGTVRDAVGKLAAGDLTVTLGLNRADEIGELAKSVDLTSNSLRQMMADVGTSSRQVAAASTQIASSAEEMAKGLRDQEDQTSRLAAAAEEMSASVTEVAKKGTECAEAAERSGQTAASGGTVVQSTIAEMQGISTQVEQSAAAISDLGTRSEQIGRIIGVINDIADQTNLLALNAAIEAARAGEHGRGFAVVADEVRKLAERTTQATDEVARSIRDMQTGTKNAVETIQSGKARVTKGVDLAQNAGSALSEIVLSSTQVREMVRSIAMAANEQSSASGEIARSIEGISTVTRQSNQAASQSAQAAAELSSQAERLTALIGRFTF